MPVPTLITELSTTAVSNYPSGSDSPATLDDVQRAHASFIAQIRDGTVAVAGTGLTGTAASLTAGNATNAASATKATNLANGLGGQIPYQSAANTTAMLANGTSGQVLTSAGGTSAPTWVAPVVTAIASDAEARALTDDTKAISPAKLASALKGTNQSLATNGYQKLPGGLIIQWGTDTLNSGTVITFPIAFPTACVSVTATTTALYVAGVSATSPTNFTGNVYRALTETTQTASCKWIALGY